MIQLHCYFFSAAVDDESLSKHYRISLLRRGKNNKYVEDVHELDNATSDGIHVEMEELRKKEQQHFM